MGYEIKFDGYWALGIKGTGLGRLKSRNGNNFSARFPPVARSLAKLPQDTIIDGEVVVLTEAGLPSFNVPQNLQPRRHARFNITFSTSCHLRRKSLRDRPLGELRELLRTKVLPKLPPEIIIFSDTLEASATEVAAAAQK